MSNSLEISNFSLMLSTLLIVLAVFIDYKEKLGLGNDILVAGVRSVIQLFFIGYILRYVLKIDNTLVTLFMTLFIIWNASYTAHTRSEGLHQSLKISLLSIGTGTLLSLFVLIVSGVIEWTPSQVVPITGMIASNAMSGIGISFRAMHSQFRDQHQQVMEKLAMGADAKQASISIVRESIKTGMAPTIDRTKTVGLVSLPGMMSGLIFAGIDPVEAIRYQIVVMFMLIGVTSLSSFIACYMAYREFYTKQLQLIE